MTDKELAEEYAEKMINHKMANHDIFVKEEAKKEIMEVFLAALNKAYEWHFVEDGDLPEKSDSTLRTLRPVIVAVKTINGLECTSYGTFWDIQAGKFECLDKVYAWCDIPEPPVPKLPKE